MATAFQGWFSICPSKKKFKTIQVGSLVDVHDDFGISCNVEKSESTSICIKWYVGIYLSVKKLCSLHVINIDINTQKKCVMDTLQKQAGVNDVCGVFFLK